MRNFEKSGSEIKKKCFQISSQLIKFYALLSTKVQECRKEPFFFLNECYSDFKMKEKKKKKNLFHGVRTYKAGH